MNKTLIVLGGPTGIGKTKLAIQLAKKLKSEIISADSRQFYKELNIGVAKPRKEELNAIPHHFISHISITTPYSIGKYEKDALNLLQKLFKKHNYIMMCGGSGLYIEAVTNGLNNFPKIDEKIKIELEHELHKSGLATLIEELKKIDIETYKKIDKNNSRRIIRALEVYRSSGKPYSFFTNQKIKTRNFKTIFLKLDMPRNILYNRINERVDNMLQNGLIEEAKKIYKYKEYQSMQTIGYQELFKYFDKKCSLEEAIIEIKKNSRRYAKRQITWFKKSKYHVIDPDKENTIIDFIKNSR
ncbi:MAG: tRNA (adenosine(37)-N6)-dimethylallyltransferase MiaA [Flavobacteriales bacterium]|nr:tRNA (adenosine(37)-N6)-dimethylallyltransferase MiaA [Flavobacteriales bacterium]|tara:strand:- start:5706 stop:6602 length:897 start_codon:yes stop_codon:yes gene_type:complete